MDQKDLYARHIADAIRKKKKLAMGGEVESEDNLELPGEEHEDFLAPAEMEEASQDIDPKAKRRARLMAILAR